MDNDLIADAVHAVQRGKIIVYPTDTLYALGTGIKNKAAVKKVFLVKNRSKTLPLPLAVSDMNLLENLVILTPLARKLADAFFPGKITLVCEKKSEVFDNVSSGKNTIAIRIPDDQIALTLLKKSGPLIATSANIHGQQPKTTISEIRKLFKEGDVEVFIDDGPRKSKPSTIVDVTTVEPKILREGSIPSTIIRKMSDRE